MKCPLCEGNGVLPDVTTNTYQKIINDLNAKAGTKYKASSAKTRKLIKARMSEGFSVNDFIYVHTVKCKEWLNDPGYHKYLRPETLYSPKFESYRNQKIQVQSKVAY